MSETLQDRLDNLRMFLCELTNDTFNGTITDEEIRDQANYHIGTMDALNKMLEGKE